MLETEDQVGMQARCRGQWKDYDIAVRQRCDTTELVHVVGMQWRLQGIFRQRKESVLSNITRLDNLMKGWRGGAAALVVIDSNGNFTHGFDDLPNVVNEAQRMQLSKSRAQLAS